MEFEKKVNDRKNSIVEKNSALKPLIGTIKEANRKSMIQNKSSVKDQD